MRYCHYGCTPSEHREIQKLDISDNEKNSEYKSECLCKKNSYNGLIIDEDTVYEIDEECINCRNKSKIIK